MAVEAYVSDRTTRDNTNRSNNKRYRDTRGNDRPAPMPFSPFSSSASSLKFRGTWAAMVMLLPVCFGGVVVRIKLGGSWDRSALQTTQNVSRPPVGCWNWKLELGTGSGPGNSGLEEGYGIPVSAAVS